MAKLSALDVLIVDDYEPMRTLLRKVLERAGVGSVRDAASGDSALDALRERPARLILADQNMPGMSGAAFVAQVRAEPQWRAARIIMVTGDTAAQATPGADAVLMKPVSPRDLLLTIQQVLAAAGQHAPIPEINP